MKHVYNADILFFHALVAAGLTPYQAEHHSRNPVVPVGQGDMAHHTRWVGCSDWAATPGWATDTFVDAALTVAHRLS